MIAGQTKNVFFKTTFEFFQSQQNYYMPNKTLPLWPGAETILNQNFLSFGLSTDGNHKLATIAHSDFLQQPSLTKETSFVPGVNFIKTLMPALFIGVKYKNSKIWAV